MGPEFWFEEKYKDILSYKYKMSKTLFSEKGPFQQVDVIETLAYGKMLINDGLVMATEKDEFVYHDMISHPAIFLHPSPKNILIIGGGDGGTAREVLRHKQVEKCVMVEIDELVVRACKEHIPQTASQLDSPKLNLIIDDGVEFVKKTQEKFDVILVDSTDPIGPAQPLFDKSFYHDIYNCLDENGIVVSQGESAFLMPDMQKILLEILSSTFPIVTLYNYTNLSYPGGLWSFSYASKKIHPLNDFDPEKVKKSSLKFNYYNEDIHRGAFALPSFQREKLTQCIKM